MEPVVGGVPGIVPVVDVPEGPVVVDPGVTPVVPAGPVVVDPVAADPVAADPVAADPVAPGVPVVLLG